MGTLDDAISNSGGPPRVGDRIDRILERLSDRLEPGEHDRLVGMFRSPLEQWGHTQLASILRDCCDAFGLDHEGVNYKNVEQYRRKLEART